MLSSIDIGIPVRDHAKGRTPDCGREPVAGDLHSPSGALSMKVGRGPKTVQKTLIYRPWVSLYNFSIAAGSARLEK